MIKTLAHMIKNPLDMIKKSPRPDGIAPDWQSSTLEPIESKTPTIGYILMDELDRNILTLLGADARMSVATLARRLKVARSTIQARLERLETTGVIAGYTLKLGEAARQGRLRASVLLTIEPRTQAAILTRLKSIPEVERVFTTSGRFDLLLQIAASNTQVLDTVLDQIGALTGVKSSESLIHLSTRLDRAV
jgi:DNA-binding Lrp family transcriptional regulator